MDTESLDDLPSLTEAIRRFSDERDWGQFHTPRNLLLALVGEVGELAEQFQWRTDEEVEALLADAGRRTAVEEELADILYYLLRIADIANIDLSDALVEKLKVNAKKYPADKVRGSATKYTDF